MHRRPGGEAVQAERTSLAGDRQQIRAIPRAEQSLHPRRPVLRWQVEHGAAFDLAPERDLRRGEGQAADGQLRVLGLGARVLQEFTPGRGGVKQIGHHDLGAERGGGRHDGRFDAPLHRDAMAMPRLA